MLNLDRYLAAGYRSTLPLSFETDLLRLDQFGIEQRWRLLFLCVFVLS